MLLVQHLSRICKLGEPIESVTVVLNNDPEALFITTHTHAFSIDELLCDHIKESFHSLQLVVDMKNPLEVS